MCQRKVYLGVDKVIPEGGCKSDPFLWDMSHLGISFPTFHMYAVTSDFQTLILEYCPSLCLKQLEAYGIMSGSNPGKHREDYDAHPCSPGCLSFKSLTACLIRMEKFLASSLIDFLKKKNFQIYSEQKILTPSKVTRYVRRQGQFLYCRLTFLYLILLPQFL